MPLDKFFVNSINITLSCFTYLDCIRKELYLANYVEILLHDHFSGCIDITNPSGVIFFIPRGFAPWDEKMTPLGLAMSMHPSK